MTAGHPTAPGRRELAAVVALTALAALARLWRLDSLPPGLHVDEAYNLLDALKVAEGWRPVFLPANAGREVLLTYLQAPLVALMGLTALSARLPGAVAGSLVVPATWFLVRGLRLAHAQHVALVAAALAGGLYWSLHFSRFGIRAILFAPIVAVTLGLWARRDRPARVNTAIPVGVYLALAAYAHPAGRGLGLVLLADAVMGRGGERVPALATAVRAWAVALVLCLPLLWTWFQSPHLAIGHVAEVTILGEGLSAVARAALAVAGMFLVSGDPAPWRNLSEPGLLGRLTGGAARPVFDPVTGVCFMVGLGLAGFSAARGGRWGRLALVALAGLLAPSVLSTDAPNFSRTIGALPLVALVAAVGMVGIVSAAISGRGRYLATALWVGALCLHTGKDYFATWASDDHTPMAFDADKVGLAGQYLAAAPAHAYLSAAWADHPTVVAAAGRVPQGFDPAWGVVVPPAGTPGVYLFLEPEGTLEREALDRLLAPPPTAWDEVPAWPSTAASPRILRLRLPPDHVGGGPRPAAAGDARFDNGAILTAVAVRTTAAGLTVSLDWVTAETGDRNWTTFVQVLDARGELVSSGDGQPLGASYPSSEWLPGERVRSLHPVIADGLSDGMRLVIGWYDAETGARAALVDAGANQSAESATAVEFSLDALVHQGEIRP